MAYMIDQNIFFLIQYGKAHPETHATAKKVQKN